MSFKIQQIEIKRVLKNAVNLLVCQQPLSCSQYKILPARCCSFQVGELRKLLEGERYIFSFYLKAHLADCR